MKREYQNEIVRGVHRYIHRLTKTPEFRLRLHHGSVIVPSLGIHKTTSA